MTRAEKVARAQELRAEGLLIREISERMGFALSTVKGWLSDPDRSREIARKDSYRGACLDCGKPTDGSNGRGKAPERCRVCTARHNAKWTREAIIAAIQRFAERYGRPPAAADFNPPDALSHGHGWRAKRFHADGDYPHSSDVCDVFGTWNAAIKAAGFRPNGTGQYPRGRNRRGAHLEAERAA